jgi:hypothetical protein
MEIQEVATNPVDNFIYGRVGLLEILRENLMLLANCKAISCSLHPTFC